MLRKIDFEWHIYASVNWVTIEVIACDFICKSNVFINENAFVNAVC